MSVRMNKEWKPLTPENVKRLGAHLGVYQIQDTTGEVIFIGFAGGRSLFGLRGELEKQLASRGRGYRFRCEVNMQYMSRHKELLMVHAAEHGQLPVGNRKPGPPRLGRIDPC
jgi:hypothetical protein